LGRKGDIVKAKPGFVRNYLLPQKKAVIATAHTLKLRASLQAEREKQAVVDKKEADALAAIINDRTVSTTVKVDPAGHMYGSVSAQDIVEIMEKEGVILERHFILLPQPIKATGEHKINLRLKEGVLVSFLLKVIPEGAKEEPAAPQVIPTEETPS
ncbi:MAG: 50S ribosomal protein L9, partial [Chlamydiae bacterium]|nr:50S ribosomal protein L9 [Chlamydiota bacterium]